jgi:heme-degrading monooxygenase HmoA
MYVQIVTYNLNGVSEQDYIDIAHQVAPQFAAMSGLHAKVWLRNEGSNTYGAVYFWEDQESQERFVASDLFEGTYPGFVNVTSEGYEVYEHLTRTTQPMLEIMEEEAGWAPPPPPPAPIEEPELMDEAPELIQPVEEPELVDDLEPADAVVIEEPEPEPVATVTRRVVKRSPRKAPAKRTAATRTAVTRTPVTKAARSAKAAKAAKVTKKALTAPRATTTRVTKVTKKVVKRPVKAGAKKAKKLR